MGKKKKKSTHAKADNGRPVDGTPSILELPIVHEFPSDLATVFANHFVVQHDNAIFRLMFFELHPPMLLADGGEIGKEALGEITSVNAKCVARIIIPADQMPKILNALATNIQRQAARPGLIAEAMERKDKKPK